MAVDLRHVDVITNEPDPPTQTSNPEQLLADHPGEALFIGVVERNEQGQAVPQAKFENIQNFLEHNTLEDEAELTSLGEAIAMALQNIPTGKKYALILEYTARGWQAHAHVLEDPKEMLKPEEDEDREIEKKRHEHELYLAAEERAEQEEIRHMYDIGVFHEPDEAFDAQDWLELAFHRAEFSPLGYAAGQIPEIPEPEAWVPTIYEVFAASDYYTDEPVWQPQARRKGPLDDLELVA